MYYRFTPEQQCLLNLAKGVWERRGAAAQHGLPFGEESVTETLLLEIALQYPGEVTIVPFNKSLEGKNGADWAWSFENADRSLSLPMMVQAKVLDKEESGYREIGRTIGNSKVLQIDRFQEHAAALGFPAIYAFYNYVSEIKRIPSVCLSLGTIEPTPIPEAWGVSLALASDVKKNIDDQSFDTHCKQSIPFHCMLCSEGTGSRGEFGSPGRVSKSLAARLLRSGEVHAEKEVPRELAPRRGVHPLFSEARELADIQPKHGSDDFLVRLREKYPGVDGVVILRDAQ